MVQAILRLSAYFLHLVFRFWKKYVVSILNKACLGSCGKNVTLRFSFLGKDLSRVFLGNGVFIAHGFHFISYSGKLIMKDRSNAAGNFYVITGNHGRELGRFIMDTELERSNEKEVDIVVEEDTEIGANVTLLAGAYIGRGATIGAGSVVRSQIPPYAIAMGNPAKIVGFCFTPDEIIEHEKMLYPEENRIPMDKLEKNYERYFKRRMTEIAQYLK